MFRTLICPSPGACEYAVELPIGRFVLGLLCVADLVRLSSIRVAGGSCGSACSPDTTQAQMHLTSNTQ